jgi:hypothetical protein
VHFLSTLLARFSAKGCCERAKRILERIDDCRLTIDGAG